MNNKNSDFVIKEINKNNNLKENQFDKETKENDFTYFIRQRKRLYIFG